MLHLKELREKKGITQAELSKILKISPSSIGMYEQGRREPDSTTLKKIATFFDVSIDYLLDNEPKQISLPALTPKDEREIARDLENMIESLKGSAAMGNVEDEEDKELLRASLETAMKLSKRIAKKKFTPKKYRHNYNEDNKKE